MNRRRTFVSTQVIATEPVTMGWGCEYHK